MLQLFIHIQLRFFFFYELKVKTRHSHTDVEKQSMHTYAHVRWFDGISGHLWDFKRFQPQSQQDLIPIQRISARFIPYVSVVDGTHQLRLCHIPRRLFP